ncbi:MAG: hypothetical protein LC775_09115, partial [Acidobacteria bacterium]|nr:hypothetical protein [Acidobacteriota bacterium]
MLYRITPFVFCFFLLAGSSLSALAQGPEAQPSATPDPELVRLQNELALEKARTALAMQQKATLAAKLPESSAVKPLEGTITVDDK